MIFRREPQRPSSDDVDDWLDVRVSPSHGDPTRGDPTCDDPTRDDDPGMAGAAGLPRSLAVCGLIAALVAVVLTGAWLQHRTRVIVAITQVAPPVTATVDATGCPVDVTCGVSPDAGGPLETAYSALFPTADLISAGSVFAAATGRSYRAELVVRTPASVLVTVVTQCIPRGVAIAPVRDRIPSAGPADALEVTPGTSGCSLSVTVHAPAGAQIPVSTILALADDRAAQLHL